MKILHLPTSTAGYAWGLASYQKQLGYSVDVLYRDSNPYGFQSTLGPQHNTFGILTSLWFRISWSFKLRKKYDIYHFNYGTSLLDFYFVGFPMVDLPWYKGIKLITFNGTDARGWAYPIYNDRESRLLDQAYNKQKLIGIKRIFYPRKIKKIQKHVDQIFAVNPDLLRYLPKQTKFVPYFISNWDSIRKIPYQIKDKIRIVHSPTNRALKGSDFIITALHKLQTKYSNIEFILVENKSHEEALQLYQQADIILDQVLIGWYGGFAVEVMKMGKPVAVFIRKEDLEFIPELMAKDLLQAIIQINTSNIFEVLESYILNPKLLEEKSEKAYAYVNRWHDPAYVHDLMLKEYLTPKK